MVLQAAPVYLSETAPAKWRGAFTSAYNAFVVIGILSATITNYFTNRIPGWGWRVSLGLAAVPGSAHYRILGLCRVPKTHGKRLKAHGKRVHRRAPTAKT